MLERALESPMRMRPLSEGDLWYSPPNGETPWAPEVQGDSSLRWELALYGCHHTAGLSPL